MKDGIEEKEHVWEGNKVFCPMCEVMVNPAWYGEMWRIPYHLYKGKVCQGVAVTVGG